MKRRLLLIGLLWVFMGFCLFPPTADSQAPSSLFPEMPGWKKPDAIQVFIPDNLYDYINGAADLYLTYDFKELQVAEYVRDDKASVIIEIYRHGSPTNAFGIYSQERLTNADFLDIGSQGYYEEKVLNFLSGSLLRENQQLQHRQGRSGYSGPICKIHGGKAGRREGLSLSP